MGAVVVLLLLLLLVAVVVVVVAVVVVHRSMQSACHALSTQCHGEEYAYLAMSDNMDTCKYHGMSCQAGPANKSTRAARAHTHTV